MSYQIQKYSDPLFPDIIWSRPEQKSMAGKLLILGGNFHGIAAPSESYALAMQAGAGEIKVIMPDKTKKLLGKAIPSDIILAPSNPSGSFSSKGLIEISKFMDWADATLFAGDFGKNSETAILLENLTKNTTTLQIYSKDAVDYFLYNPIVLFNRPKTLIVVTLAQLQRLLISLKSTQAIKYDMGLDNLCKTLNSITTMYPIIITVQYYSSIITSFQGSSIVTKLNTEPKIWRLKTAASSAVWWLQNKSKPLESVSTAITQITW